MTPVVGHVVRSWLPRSATFIHTTVRFQTGAVPVVLAANLEQPAEFPVERLVALTPADAPPWRRAVRRLRARAAGHRDPFGHRLAQEGRRAGCALLHAHFGHTGWRCLPALRELEVPLVTTFYGWDLGLARRPEWRERYRSLFAEGAAFCVEGPAMARTLTAHGCADERVHLVPIGLDLGLFPYVPRPRSSPLTVVQTGRMVDKKGFDVALRAFARARPRLGDARLVLIGDGPLRPELEELAARLGLASAVRFTGSLDHAAYRRALAEADVGLQASRTAADGDTEGGAPTVLLEMQAAGIPVVGTRHADIPWVVAAGDALADEEDDEGLADVLVRVGTESDRDRRDRVERGRALVEGRHDATRVAARLLEVYAAAGLAGRRATAT